MFLFCFSFKFSSSNGLMIIFDQNNHHNSKQWKLTKSNSQNCRKHARTATASLLFFLSIMLFLSFFSTTLACFRNTLGQRQCAHFVLCKMLDRSNTFMIEHLAHTKSHRFPLPFSFHYFENRFHLTRIAHMFATFHFHTTVAHTHTHTTFVSVNIARATNCIVFANDPTKHR